MPLGWCFGGVGEHFPGKGYKLGDRVKYQSSPMKASSVYLLIQIAIGLLFMFFTINQGFPFEWWERLFMSIAIFVMIFAWSGILQSKTWARVMETFRLVVMAAVLLSTLERHGLITWTGWAAILTALWCGFSILWLTVKMTSAEELQTMEA